MIIRGIRNNLSYISNISMVKFISLNLKKIMNIYTMTLVQMMNIIQTTFVHMNIIVSIAPW